MNLIEPRFRGGYFLTRIDFEMLFEAVDVSDTSGEIWPFRLRLR